MHAFKDLLNIVPPAKRITDENVIEFLIEIQFVRVLRMEFQMWKSFFRRLDGLRVSIDPDFHYRGVFDLLLESLEDASARAQIEEARRRILDSTYVLAEIRRPLP